MKNSRIRKTVAVTAAAFALSASASSVLASESDPITITYATAAALNSMDPSLNSSGESMIIIRYCNEGLYKLGPNGEVTLGMASDVSTSEDGLTWTFTIRKDAVWSNGESVTANDFVYSWKRLSNPETGAEYAYMLVAAGVKNAADVCFNGADMDTLGIEAVDDQTLVVTLDHPVSYLPSLLTGSYFVPINQEFCEAQGDQFGLSLESSLFNGMYTLTDWEVGGTYVKMEKNPDYYAADEVTTDVLEANVTTDAQQLIMGWESGTLDTISLAGDNVDMYKDDLAFYSSSLPMMYFLSFNMDNENLANQNLRMAISTAIDKQSICDYILKNGSVPANYIIPDQFAMDEAGKTFREEADATYLEYDVDAAKESWELAKEELGTDNVEINLLYDEDSTLALVAAEIQSELQSNLEGLTVTLTTEPKNQRVDDMGKGNYEIGLTRWGADYQDASTYLDMWTANSNYNYGNWQNDRYNELYDLVYAEYATEPEKRLEAMIEQESIVLGEAAICPLYQSSNCGLLTTEYEFPYSVTMSSYLLYYAQAK